MRMVGADSDEELDEEDVLVLVPVEEGGGGDDGAVEVPFVAKRAARVLSFWGTKVLVPVRSARISSEMVDCCGEECAT